MSERRARVVLALLTGDVGDFKEVAEEEAWGVGEAQVMLRALRCDPGPADGTIGILTTRAIEIFQNQFNTAMFHRHLALSPPPPIPVTREYDQPTRDALLEAFVCALSLHVDGSQLHPTHPIAGCSEFNPFGSDARINRRVSIALYPKLPPHHEKAPCRTGDHTACPVQKDQVPGCFWYREHFIEQKKESVQARHFDLRWLFVDDTRVLLTALSTAEDGTAVDFQVFRSPELAELDEVSDNNLGEPLSESLPGTILNGVAFCEWTFGPEEVELSRPENWITPIPFEEARGQDLFSRVPTARVPVFRVKGGGAVAVSAPPLHDALRSVWVEDEAPLAPYFVWMADTLGRVFHALFEGRSAESKARVLSTHPQAADLPLR